MQYRILGPLAVVKDGSEVVMGSGKQRALLALLLLHANEAISTDRLIDQLWGESHSTSAVKVLQNYVSKLRRLLGEGVLITRAQAYELRVESGELDLDRFNDLVAEGRRALAARDPARGAAALEDALALWRGPPLADFAYEQFARAEIERLDGLRFAALTERIEADLQLGRHDALIGELESLVARHPLQERLRGQLMLALYRSGRQAEALQVYKATRRVLVDELGIEPSHELRQLEQAILVHDPLLEPPPIAKSRVARTRTRARLAVVALLIAIAVAGILIAGRRGGSKAISAAPGIGAIDPKTDKLVGAVPVTSHPISIAAGMGQVRALSPGSLGGTMLEIDPSSLTVTDTRSVSAIRGVLSSIAFAADQGWVVTYNGTLAVITLSGSITPITFERRGYGDLSDVAVTGNSIWVASQRQRAVFKIDRTTLRLVARVRTSAVPLAVAANSAGVWVAGFDKSSRAGVLTRIDPMNDTVSATIPLPGLPGDLATGFGGVWVTVDSQNAIWRIDPATNSVARTIPVGSSPIAVAVGEGSVWVANVKDGTVSRIDPRTNEVVATIPVGGSPRDVAVGSGRIWVAAP
jgi:YVTN family beta-propeller protein